jgi:ATP-binding cassette subfamily B protein
MVIGFVMLRSIRSRHLRVQEQLGLLTTYCQESFSGLRIVRGLGLESFRFKTFQGMNQDYIRRNLKLSRVEIMTWPLIQSGFVLGNVMLLWSGGIRVIQGEISLGMLVEFQQYLMILQWPALSVAWTMSLVLRGRASLTRLQDVLAEEPPVYGGTQLTDPSKAEVQPIVFDQVSLSLEGRPVLHDVSFRVEPGQMLGITGPTGSGKTLLLQMVLRRQDPDAGRIWFGDTDIREMPLETLYRIFRIAAQEPVLFSMSLRENLLLADAEVSEEALQQALYLSALQHDLEQLPDGLETKIGERGVTLSGGQRQRSAIARALISDPPVLMLDDSLSAVDTSTESRILERLLPAVRGRTLMMVSHRYAALRHCDQVLVLREGRVEQAGRPSDLLAQGGYFAELELRQRLQAQLEEGE